MGFSFQIEKTLGEFKLSLKAESQGNRLGILGASGCGKSLTLKRSASLLNISVCPRTTCWGIPTSATMWKRFSITTK